MTKKELHPVVWIAIVGGPFSWVACLIGAIVFAGSRSRSDPKVVNGTEFLAHIGDTFGIVNSLFSMAAMIGAAFAVYFQRRELDEVQQHRLDEQREIRFFQLVVLLRDASDRAYFYYRDGFGIDRKAVGVDAFEEVYFHGDSEAIQGRLKGFAPWVEMSAALMEFVLNTENEQQRTFFENVLHPLFSKAQVGVLDNFAEAYEDDDLRGMLDEIKF